MNDTGVVGARVAPELARASGRVRAGMRHGLAPDFWRDVPGLSWLMNLDTGRVAVCNTHTSPDAHDAPAFVDHDALAEALRRALPRGPEAMRLSEVLAGADGKLHHFLIMGFPVRGQPLDGRPGAPAHYMAGVAIDFTRHQAGIEELAQQALVDELTGLYNLRGFFLFAEHELKVSRRRGTRCAVLYVDVDGLKQVNDRHGHKGGDAVLVATAVLLRQVFRECDVIARLGGDEFAVFAANVNADPAQLAARLTEALARRGIAEPVALSVSTGIGSLAPDPALQLRDLLVAADGAMLEAKARRRELQFLSR